MSIAVDQRFWTPVAQLEVAGEHLGVWRHGDTGPAVVAAHGIEDGWESWGAVAERIGARHRVYALDRPWRAGNRYAWPDRDDPAGWLRRAIDLVPEPADLLLGHSFGANAILQHVAESPDRLPALLLTPFYRPSTVAEDQKLYERTLADFHTIIGDGLRLRLGPRAANVDDALLTAMVQQTVRRVGSRGLMAMFDQFRHTTRLRLSDMDTPVLVLTGPDDVAMTPARAAAFAAAAPSAAVCVLPDLTHFCHLAQVEQVATVLTEFLDHQGSGSS
ncbi:alpha/beta fold hydrolase [Actinokineospora sp.]|uniref:alpha/beta fold hydrolase n=1 Tax=Actinokineospora sp. TaxID=1872133 RepID=UPI003D6B4D5E